MIRIIQHFFSGKLMNSHWQSVLKLLNIKVDRMRHEHVRKTVFLLLYLRLKGKIVSSLEVNLSDV